MSRNSGDAEPGKKWRRGEPCRVKLGDKIVDGEILLASENGVSLIVKFNAMLGGYLGSAPLLWRNGNFFDLIEDRRVDLLERADK